MAIVNTGKKEINNLIGSGKGFHVGETWLITGLRKFSSTQILNEVLGDVSIEDDLEMNRGCIVVITPNGVMPQFNIGDDTEMHVVHPAPILGETDKDVLQAIRQIVGGRLSVGTRVSLIIIMDFGKLTRALDHDQVNSLVRGIRYYNLEVGASCLIVNPLDHAATMLAGYSGEFFLNQVVGKGYHSGSRTLSANVDGELYVHPDSEVLKLVVGKDRGRLSREEEEG